MYRLASERMGKVGGKAKATGLDVVEVDELVKKSDIIMILAPDTSQKKDL